MHPHLIDWFREVDIDSSAAVAEGRWKLAQRYAETLTRASVLRLLRLFLFAETPTSAATQFTEEILKLDREFPVANNAQLVRLLAGVIILSTLKPRSEKGVAFALGFDVSLHREEAAQPVQPEIVNEVEIYLQVESDRQRPATFQMASSNEQLLSETSDELDGELSAKELAVGVNAIKEGFYDLQGQVRRLAEESALLWWVIGEYSVSLKCSTTELTGCEYALVAASEAAERTLILPPPISAGALVSRALKPCKPASKKNPTLKDYLKSVDGGWRRRMLEKLRFEDCMDFVPFLTGLAKSEEFGSALEATKVLPKLCTGLKIDAVLSSEEVGRQGYRELVFLKSLAALND